MRKNFRYLPFTNLIFGNFHISDNSVFPIKKAFNKSLLAAFFIGKFTSHLLTSPSKLAYSKGLRK